MKRFLSLIAFASALSLCAAPMGIVVPAYFYPGNRWTGMNWAAGRVPLVAIMNPNSGPDTTQNPDYVAAVKQPARQRGKGDWLRLDELSPRAPSAPSKSTSTVTSAFMQWTASSSTNSLTMPTRTT